MHLPVINNENFMIKIVRSQQCCALLYFAVVGVELCRCEWEFCMLNPTNRGSEGNNHTSSSVDPKIGGATYVRTRTT
jgi:hypothetical protein